MFWISNCELKSKDPKIIPLSNKTLSEKFTSVRQYRLHVNRNSVLPGTWRKTIPEVHKNRYFVKIIYGLMQDVALFALLVGENT